MIRAAGGAASFRRTDVLVAADIEALVKQAVSEYGGLDLAFNNAGIEGKCDRLLSRPKPTTTR
jgi:NAD(P)-dependent dehydrogenase (short-subunit alcohol dehydrogenase family)